MDLSIKLANRYSSLCSHGGLSHSYIESWCFVIGALIATQKQEVLPSLRNFGSGLKTHYVASSSKHFRNLSTVKSASVAQYAWPLQALLPRSMEHCFRNDVCGIKGRARWDQAGYTFYMLLQRCTMTSNLATAYSSGANTWYCACIITFAHQLASLAQRYNQSILQATSSWSIRISGIDRTFLEQISGNSSSDGPSVICPHSIFPQWMLQKERCFFYPTLY